MESRGYATGREARRGAEPALDLLFWFDRMFSVLLFQREFFYPGFNRDIENGMEGNNSTCGLGKNGVFLSNFYDMANSF